MWILVVVRQDLFRELADRRRRSESLPGGRTSTGERVTMAHPQYPAQRHVMPVCEVAGSEPVVRFAAGEFSSGVWVFAPLLNDSQGAGDGT